MIPPLSPREEAGWWAGLAPWLLLVVLLACCWWLAGCESWGLHCGPWGLRDDDCLGLRPGGGL